MSSGTDAPPEKPDADGKRGFDDAWTALLGDAPAPATAAASPESTAAEADPAEAAPDPAEAASDPAEAGPDPADSVSGLADELQVGRTAEPDVALGGPERGGDATMATMMSGSWAMATRDASSTAAGGEPTDGKDLRESDAEMAALMGAELDAALARHRAAAGKDAPIAVAREPARTEAVRPDDGEAKPSERPRAVASAAPRRMVAPEPRRITGRAAVLSDTEPRGRLSLGWAAAAGVVIAGAIWWFQRPPERDAAMRSDEAKRIATKSEIKSDTKSKRAEPETKPTSDRLGTPASADLAARAPDRPVDPLPVDDGDGTNEPEPTPPKPKPESATKPLPTTPDVATRKTPVVAPSKPGGDPRTPPAGTPAEIAAVFVRLPVSPADLPPVGGVGATGVHIDRVEMGASYDKTGCGGVADRFSLAGIERVNVCLRVVHPRAEETVSIVWQKNDGSTARRGKIAIKPLHAYRTRAYLVLRKEYVGDWTVRIMSADGVELASHAFTIAP